MPGGWDQRSAAHRQLQGSSVAGGSASLSIVHAAGAAGLAQAQAQLRRCSLAASTPSPIHKSLVIAILTRRIQS